MKRPLKGKLSLKRRTKAESERPERITNDTVSAHRERILAGGRRFKYPVQYSKHKLVINSVIIAVVAVALLIFVIWYELYPAQNTSKFFYRITQLVPVPVASVNGESVRYSDYLRDLRVDIYTLQNLNQINVDSKAGQQQIAYLKRQELTKAEKNAYARKLAKKYNLSVSSKEIDQIIKQQRDAQHVTMQAYVKTAIEQYYDWSLGEYKQEIHDRLLTQKVSFAVDQNAKERADNILRDVKADPGKFSDIAKRKSDDKATSGNGGKVGSLPTDGSADASSLVSEAKQLKKGQISGLIKRPDGYYIIKLLDKNSSSVSYAQIQIKLTKFDEMFSQVQQSGQIHEYIDLKQS